LFIRKVLLDCGVVQADALSVDPLASLEKAYSAYLSIEPDRLVKVIHIILVNYYMVKISPMTMMPHLMNMVRKLEPDTLRLLVSAPSLMKTFRFDQGT
ncbi:hypothetical protein MKW94_028072, partial [Papaver nudicaule]|nr:hypothetical protein [Papaver nudicaule]